jgi:glutamine amidotransferase
MVAIIDYGLGNLRSVEKAFQRIGANNIQITADEKTISESTHLVLPGVGHFGRGINNLRERELIPVLNEEVLNKKKPILGICLGMQLMGSYSEESNTNGLDWIQSKALSFKSKELEKNLKIPHMGWNDLILSNSKNDFEFPTIDKKFYFTHSYFMECENENDVLSYTEYGVKFVSSFKNKNIIGMQFHPEKSHEQGLLLLKEFLNM